MDERVPMKPFLSAGECPVLPISDINQDAIRYVGTHPVDGITQLNFLINEGLTPQSKVLEVGCGALVAGYPLIHFLSPGNYAGIEPNRWLIDFSLRLKEVQLEVRKKRPIFLYNENFDASGSGYFFDYVISHSILSHAAGWQYEQFLTHLKKSLRKGSKIIASLRFQEGNRFGSEGSVQDERDFDQWQYPGNSFFRKNTIIQGAESLGYEVRIAEEYTEWMTRACPSCKHDWVVFTLMKPNDVP